MKMYKTKMPLQKMQLIKYLSLIFIHLSVFFFFVIKWKSNCMKFNYIQDILVGRRK